MRKAHIQLAVKVIQEHPNALIEKIGDNYSLCIGISCGNCMYKRECDNINKEDVNELTIEEFNYIKNKYPELFI